MHAEIEETKQGFRIILVGICLSLEPRLHELFISVE